jgi:hypothetical protein
MLPATANVYFASSQAEIGLMNQASLCGTPPAPRLCVKKQKWETLRLAVNMPLCIAISRKVSARMYTSKTLSLGSNDIYIYKRMTLSEGPPHQVSSRQNPLNKYRFLKKHSAGIW